MRQLFLRLLGFTALPVLAGVVTIAVLPFVSRAAGVEHWTAFGAGQAIGAYASTIAFVGWNVLGTPMVAQARDAAEQLALYGRSFYARMIVIGMVLVPAAVVAVLVVPAGTAFYGIAFMVGSTLNALSVSWYAVGIANPMVIGKYELWPRALASALSVPAVLLTGDIIWYAVAMIVAPLAGVVAFHLKYYTRVVPPWPGRTTVIGDLTGRKAAWSVEVSGNLYVNAPAPIASALTPPVSAAAYASGDKTYRYALMAVTAVGNSLQGWVLEVDGESRRRRNSAAIWVMVGVGVIGGLLLAVFGAPFTAVFFGANLAAKPELMAWLGLSFACVSASTPIIRNVLMPARRERSVLVVTLSGAAVGLALMIFCSASIGSTGVAVGLAVSELIVLLATAVLAARTGLSGPVSEG